MATEWISHAEAAAIVACAHGTVERYARRGLIRRRYEHNRKTPTLDRASVEMFAVRWQEQRRLLAERLAEQHVRQSGPPDDGERWLDCTTSASVLGVSVQYLGRLAAVERVPAVREGTGRGTRWWFRRRDIEQLARVRSVRQAAR